MPAPRCCPSIWNCCFVATFAASCLILTSGCASRPANPVELQLLEPPRIVETERSDAAVIHLTIPRYQMQVVMGAAIGEVMERVAAQGAQPTGPIFCHHFTIDPETFDFVVGVPVDKPIERDGRVQPGELPAARVMRTIYQGNYDGLGNAWQEFDAWIAGEGLHGREDLWECYLSGPETDPDPATWRTQLNRPLAAR